VRRAVTAILGVAVAVASTAGAGVTVTADGWWKGTIVLEQDLGIQNGKPRADANNAYRGSATLRIELTAPETANYDFSYSEELWGAPNGAYCPGKLQRSTAGSLKQTAGVKAFANGSVLRVVPKVDFRVTTTESDCPGYVAGRTTTRKIKLDYIEFAPGKGSGRWQGSGKLSCCYSNGEFPKPGETSVTWDITKVTAAKPTTGSSGSLKVGKVRLWRYRPSIVEAEVSLENGGAPPKASTLTCTTDFPTEKSFGGPKVTKWPKVYLLKLAPPGEVHCLHGFNNRRYEGKVMTGITEFTVGKQKVTRKYSVRIGSGTSLSQAKGAVIGK
jgi:hypothetical protein